MNIRYNAYPLFPSVVHYIKLNDFEQIKKEIIDFVYQEKRINPFFLVYKINYFFFDLFKII